MLNKLLLTIYCQEQARVPFNELCNLMNHNAKKMFLIQLGMGSALETLCGQAYGAGQIRMLGVYMQRSWVILLTTACCLVPIYVFAAPILELFGEATEISEAAGME